MKELSIEEKAKRYDEVVDRLRYAFNSNRCTLGFMNEILHYPRESEDERVKQKIIKLIKKSNEVGGYALHKWEADEMLVWLEKQGEHKKFRDSIQVGDEVTRNSDGVIVNLSQLKRVAKKDEKQGEQKPSTEVKPKFKVGDWVVYCGKTCKITGLHNGIFTITNQDGSYFFNQVESTMEPIFHLWTIQDAKDGDVLHFSDETIVIFKDLYNETTFHSYCHIEDGLFDISKDEMPDWWEGKGFHPATKEQRDLLFQKMREAGYEWDSEKKELKKIELSDVGHEYYSELLKNDKSDNIADYAYQCVYCMSHDWAIENPTWDNVQSACRLGAKWQKKHNVSEEWSEEDEKVSKYALDIPQNWTKEDKERYISCLQRLSTGNPEQPETINSKWFKEHVYPQKQWKPSDEQIRALEYIINNAHNTSYSCKIAKELLEQLKKLKGE